MKVLVVIGPSVLALAFLVAPVHFLITRGWGLRRGAFIEERTFSFECLHLFFFPFVARFRPSPEGLSLRN